MTGRAILCMAALGLALGAARASAQTPSPISPTLHAFPGSVLGTTSAASSAVAFADRWLGDEPFLDPAVAPARALSVSPVFENVSRQDLRSGNRQFDDAPAFDASGGWLAFGAGPVALFAYGWQPVLRHEDISFIRGEEDTPPAVVSATSTMRETRAGAGAAYGRGPWRVGVAGEWTRRDDAYDYHETSGDPGSGTRRATLSGDGFGIAVGARYDVMLEVLGASSRLGTLGVAVRTVPALDLTGTQTLHLLTGDSETALAAHRGATVEYGVSLQVLPSPGVSLMAQVGRHGEEGYTDAASVEPAVVGLPPVWRGVKAGPTTQWSLGLDYTEPDQPLSIRCGAGQEVQTGVPEPRAGLFALGAGWRFDPDLRVDLAVVRRAFARAGKATSYDDRVVGTLVVGL